MSDAAADSPAADSLLSTLTAAVLAGGLGTRLRPVVSDRPKVLAEVDGRPFLARLLDQLVEAGVRRVILCTGYRGQMVEQAFGASYRELQLVYSCEQQPLGTGGALRAAWPRADSGSLLVLNGDSLCRTDLAAFAQSHVARQAAASLVLTTVEDTSRYGRVELLASGEITRFAEKSPDSSPGWINSGIYLLAPRFVESIPPATEVSLERAIFPKWIGRGLYGHCDRAAFIDIGTPESYSQAISGLPDRLR